MAEPETNQIVDQLLVALEIVNGNLNRLLSDTIILREECETWKRRAEALETDRLRRGK